MVDSQSFPFQSQSSPEIVKGAYAPSAIYTMNDVQMITQYAGERGVRMLVEIDVPGHSWSWGIGYPDITASCPDYESNVNNIALNPALDKTYEILTGVLSDVIKATNQKYIHLGGDEVVYSCWKEDASITSFMSKNNIKSYNDMMGYFVAKADNIALELKASPIHWEEVFTAGVKVPSETIFEVWTNSSMMSAVTGAGFDVIAAPSNKWYLNTRGNPPEVTSSWETMYSYDPAVGLTSEQSSHIIGGECALWGEYADDTNWIQIAFPRASAVSERLWSQASVNDINEVTNRLEIQICRLNQRGYKVSPLAPSYCGTSYV
jgi:hexosaminidase